MPWYLRSVVLQPLPDGMLFLFMKMMRDQFADQSGGDDLDAREN